MIKAFSIKDYHTVKNIKSWGFLGILIILYLILFWVFYPPILGIEDEAGFIKAAIIWAKGSLSGEGAGILNFSDLIPTLHGHVPWRNPGRSLFIIPFIKFAGIRMVFWSGAIIHVFTTLATARVFEKLSRAPLWAALVLLHPTLALYSRSITADELVGCFLLLAYLSWVQSHRAIRRSSARIGFFLSLAALTRYYVFPVFLSWLIFLASRGVRSRRTYAVPRLVILWKAIGTLILAGCLVAIPIVTYDFWLFGSILPPAGGFFSLQSGLQNLPFYALSLNLVWPGMLVLACIGTSRKTWELRAFWIPTLLLMNGWYFHDTWPSWPGAAIIGTRLVQSTIPFLILGAIEGLLFLKVYLFSTVQTKTYSTLRVSLCTTGLALLFSTNWMIFKAHQAHLQNLVATQNEVKKIIPSGSAIAANSAISKLFSVPFQLDDEMLEYSWTDLNLRSPNLKQAITSFSETNTKCSLEVCWIAILKKENGPKFLESSLPKRAISVESQIPGLTLWRLPALNPESKNHFSVL